ncbi:hypothetical protein IV203_035260 [Nitzschia inconspicua]|uniref:Uncharacterized protein n=1 Tax=Nitzschia inconspicua TaxID=303405 RepID=A0A9K3PUR9_9STRA|nr:hypothetical protein IV203_035260 [Nitzschia inconspicua]
MIQFRISCCASFCLANFWISVLSIVSLVAEEHRHDSDTSSVSSLSPDEIALLDSLEMLQKIDLDGAHSLLEETFLRSSRNPDPQQRINRLSQRKISLGGGTTYTSEYKLRADHEQALYLATALMTSDPEKAEFFGTVVAPTYERLLKRIPPLEELQATMGLYQFQQTDVQDGIMNVYNRALHVPPVSERRDDGTRIPIFSDDIRPSPLEIQQEWAENGIVVVDNVLSKEALQLIQEKIMWESTVWYQTKLPERFGGYTGAYIDDGLHQRILLQLSLDLRDLLPQIFENHPLKYMWAYKYDSDYGGINLHADEAAVNVNLWLTPNQANLDPNCGGLVVYTVRPPEDWDFERYNRDTDFVYDTLIAPSNFANVTIPYRENRAVIFDSALFHTTDHFRFQKGYKNRRINLTLLYGEMKKQQSSSGNQNEL